jgi:hypothetical protein
MKTGSVIFMALVVIMGVCCQQKPAALSDAQKAEIVKQVTERQIAFGKVFDELNVQTFSQFLSQNQFSAFINRLDWYLNKQACLIPAEHIGLSVKANISNQ